MVFHGKDGRLHTALDVELTQHALHMHLHGGFREVKRTGDFLIGNASHAKI